MLTRNEVYYVPKPNPFPACGEFERRFARLNHPLWWLPLDFSFLGKTSLLCLNPPQEFTRRLVTLVLLNELSPHSEVENEAAQTRDRAGSIADAVEMVEE